MNPIVSRRHTVNFYLTLLLAFAFLLALGAFMITIFIKERNHGPIKSSMYFLPVFGALVILVGVYTVYQYYKNAPKIVIDRDFISFNAQTFSISVIKKIKFTGKQSFPYLIYYPMEAAALHFKDGSEKLIFDDMYENAWQLKLYLKYFVVDKKDAATESYSHVDPSELTNEVFDTFKNNQFLSLRGLSLWPLFCMFLWATINNNKKTPPWVIIFILLFCVFWVTVHAWLMHYVKVSGRFLVIRNHVFFWKKTAYRLSDISEIVFETRGKMPHCIRVITKDFRNKLYPAGTLHKNTWLDLNDRLKREGIQVRNECSELTRKR